MDTCERIVQVMDGVGTPDKVKLPVGEWRMRQIALQDKRSRPGVATGSQRMGGSEVKANSDTTGLHTRRKPLKHFAGTATGVQYPGAGRRLQAGDSPPQFGFSAGAEEL